MLRKLAVLAALTCVMAFGQYRAPGAGTSGSSPSPKNSGSDAGSVNDLQMKSIDQVLHDDPRLFAKLKEMLPTLAVRYICLFFISFLSFATPRKSSRIFSRLLIELY